MQFQPRMRPVASPIVRGFFRYAVAALGLSLLLLLFHSFAPSLNHTAVALVLVLLVISLAVLVGRGPSLSAAILAGLAFNYLFIEPIHTLRITRYEDLISFLVFVITALVVGELSSRLEMRVEQAEARRAELERVMQRFKLASAQAAEAEGLRKNEQLKSALLDAVTHDLRTPLTSIKVAITTVRNAELSREARQELYEVIEQESDRLNRFIESMMDLAKVETGNLHLESRTVFAGEIIEDALQRADPLLTNHVVEVSITPSLPSMKADPRLMSEVLFNLIANAAKYSPLGSRIGIYAEVTHNNGIGFAVTDQGPGIAADLRTQVFDKFFRHGQHSGFGVGLAVVRGIVQAHDGTVWIESGPGGRGATVRFDIPSGERS